MNKNQGLFWGLLVVMGTLLLSACHLDSNRTVREENQDSLYHSDMLKSITDSIQLFPDNAGLYFERGGLLFVMKEYAMAEKDVQKAIALDPMKSTYFIALGELKLISNHYVAAEKAYRQALILDSTNLRARLQLGYVLYQQGKYPETIQQTDTLLGKEPSMAEAYGLQSQAYQSLGDSAKALMVMQKAVSLAPHNYDALMAMGDLLLKQQNSQALSYYREASQSDTMQGEPYYGMGLFYETQKQTDSAISAYNHCIRTDAYYADAYLKLGGLYEQKNNWKKGWEVFNLAIKVSPTNSTVYYQRGWCSENMNKIKEAIADYEQALTFDKNNPAAQQALDRLQKPDPEL